MNASEYRGPRPREVHVWWALLRDLRPEHQALLNGVEQARAAAYLREDDRARFTLGVALSRSVLGATMATDPAGLPIERTCPECGRPHGRPQLANGPHFSLSHSGDVVGLALATFPVGLDVEQIVATGDLDALARHTFGATFEDEGEFFARWTRTEAVLKATGDGLTVPMREVTLPTGAGLARLATRPQQPIMLTDVEPPRPGYAAALATLGTQLPTVRAYRFSSPTLPYTR